jgi:hypothetical protein
MSGSPFQTAVLCPQCGTDNPSHAKTCWLCRASLAGAQEVVTAELVARQRPSPLSETFFLILTLGCVVLLVIVGIGLAQQDVGLLIPYVILIAPPILATVSRSMISAKRGQHVGAMEVFLTFMVSASVTALIVMILVGASFIALFIYCVYVCTQM